MYVCLECRHICDEEDIITWKEDRGEYWGTPCYEEKSGCPHCKGNCVKAFKCDSCEEWITELYIKTDDGKRYCVNCYCQIEIGEE